MLAALPMLAWSCAAQAAPTTPHPAQQHAGGAVPAALEALMAGTPASRQGGWAAAVAAVRQGRTSTAGGKGRPAALDVGAALRLAPHARGTTATLK